LGPKGHLDNFYSFLLISVSVLRQLLIMVFMTRKIKDKKYNKKVFDPRNNLG
jgi:hydrogenase-4 membrane subunit HyfE